MYESYQKRFYQHHRLDALHVKHKRLQEARQSPGGLQQLWAANVPDTLMKRYFYPDVDKSRLFELEYIMEKSGHTRGSTVDLTLFDMNTEKEVDMGGTFDWFGEESHPDYRGITEEQFANRMILRDAMVRHGFKTLDSEWWHFTLKDEPYPDTYFTFPVR